MIVDSGVDNTTVVMHDGSAAVATTEDCNNAVKYCCLLLAVLQ